MNKAKFLKLTTFLALALPMTISCGGGDDGPSSPPQESITAEEYQIREICKIFGLNANDYDITNVRSNDEATIAVMHNKNNNSLFVGIVDPKTNQILFSNSNQKVSPTKQIQYYDKSYECKYVGSGFGFVRKSNGLFFAADLWYESDDATVRECLPIIYIYNGKQTMMAGVNNPISEPARLIDWYDDSCIISLNNEYTCYTVDGKPVFTSHDNSKLNYAYEEYKCFLSYREFITASYDIYAHTLTINKIDVTESGKVVKQSVSLFEDMPHDTRNTISFQKTSGHVTIEVIATSKDGKTETAILDFNTETNEITRTK